MQMINRLTSPAFLPDAVLRLGVLARNVVRRIESAAPGSYIRCMTGGVLSAVVLTVLSAPFAVAQDSEALPGTKPLSDTTDLSEKMVDGLHRWLDRKLRHPDRIS